MQIQTSTQEMIKELKEVKGLFANSEKFSNDRSLNAQSHQQLMLEMAVQLQASLETENVIHTFMQYVHSYLLFDGYSFDLASLDINIAQSRQKGHSCKYNLSLMGESLGELVIYRGRKYAESELILLESMICSMLYSLRNTIYYRKAILSAHQDSLTGAKNRSSFDASLNREIGLAERYHQPFSLLVIDIDHFKKVNDTYGHSTGDEVLKNVAENIQESIRNTDLLFRYGGEEFVVLLGNSSCEAAHEIADRILDTVRSASTEFKDQKLSVSVSIGLACLEEKDNPHTLFDRADEALYMAKDQGRDQIKVA